MKIAILILAHKNPDQLERLIDHLKKDFSVYVHINKKVRHSFTDEEKVKFIADRYIPYWGSPDTPKAMLALLREAHKDGCDYFMFISGQDLPLKPNSELATAISDNPVSYVYYHKLPKASWRLNGGLDRIELFWPRQFEFNSLPGKIWGVGVKGGFWIIRKLQLLTGIKRKYNFAPWGGSMWLNLNIDAVEFIFQYIEKHPEYMPRFDYTRLSDELFFHSILLGNDFEQKDKIVCDDMRFVDWETGPQYPRVFTITDLDRLSSTKNFFARKFDCSIDNQIIEELYRRI